MNSAEIRDRFAVQLSWPDWRLVAWAAGVIGNPKEEAADSFVLHAPLELMARAALLPSVRPGDRQGARERLVSLVTAYQSAGDDVPSQKPISPQSVDEGMSSLSCAVEASDLEQIDSYASWLGEHATFGELKRGLGPALAPSLGAAAHGSIALHLLGRTPAIGNSAIRAVVREIGRHPEWNVHWEGLAKGERPLLDALLEVPQLGMPGSNFIFPMVMHGAEASAQLLADVSDDPSEAQRALSRVAAWSMLQDSPEHAPYGWTHTLTIPHAVMSLGIPRAQAVSVAAGQMVGFRASMGTQTLDPCQPYPVSGTDAVERLASTASLHHDAHLVKYTLACFDAANADPDMAGLYLAAASHLASWWSSQPDDGFFPSSAR